MIQQLTANLAVERVEPSAEFFKKIGFEISVQVPEGDHIGFAILVNGANQVMFQTRTGILEDSKTMAAAAVAAPMMLYVTVDDLEAIKSKMDGYPVQMAERETFYGAKEISYNEPGGHIVTFAEFPDRA